MFELTNQEFINLRYQSGTSTWQSIRYAPMAFTEHGVIMLASILNSERAVKVNIQIIRIYNKMREVLRDNKKILQKLERIQDKIVEHDNSILSIIEYINQLEKEKQTRTEQQERRSIGFK
jgi:phage regulator Rha-like protein